jgi:hypothetical protein
MPYIQQSRREEITDSSLVETAGELNWLLTILINDYIGVLECAKLELYRRVVSPYEETKMQQHGDVYK